MDQRRFNAEHAKAGAPYSLRNRQEAEIIKWDRNGKFPLVVLLGVKQSISSRTLIGRLVEDTDSEQDLVMTPLGFVDGKPVWTDDELWTYSSSGSKISFKAKPSNRDFSACHWPKPPREYPVTQMTDGELEAIWSKDMKVVFHSVFSARKALANAALKHAIDAGQVIAKEDQAIRDMLVAKAVRDICASRTTPQIALMLDSVDLAIIIESLEPK